MSKYQVQLITAHNGVEVLIATNTAYIHTEFDDIIAAWREQENKRCLLKRNEQMKIKNQIINIINTIRRNVA